MLRLDHPDTPPMDSSYSTVTGRKCAAGLSHAIPTDVNEREPIEREAEAGLRPWPDGG